MLFWNSAVSLRVNIASIEKNQKYLETIVLQWLSNVINLNNYEMNWLVKMIK